MEIINFNNKIFNMQDVLRKIYFQKHLQLQNRKKERQFNLDQQSYQQRFYKGIGPVYRSPISDHLLNNQILIKRKMEFSNDFLSKKSKQVIQQYSQRKKLSLPSISGKKNKPEKNQLQKDQNKLQQHNKIKNSRINQSFKLEQIMKQKNNTIKVRKILNKSIKCIVFMIRLKRLVISRIGLRQQLMKRYTKQFVQMSQGTINQYYCQYLQQQLLAYLQLLKNKLIEPQQLIQKQILNNLLKISKKLKNSRIPNELVCYMALITCRNCYFPDKYLTNAEILKFKFNQKYGYVDGLNQLQKNMIIANCVGIRILCKDLLYNPWKIRIQNAPINSYQILQNYDALKRVITGTGSILYYIILQQFYQDLALTSAIKMNELQKLGISFESSINIFPQNYPTHKLQKPLQLFPNQNRKLYQSIKSQNQQIFRLIKENVVQWLNNVIKVCQKQRFKILQYKYSEFQSDQLFNHAYNILKKQKHKVRPSSDANYKALQKANNHRQRRQSNHL